MHSFQINLTNISRRMERGGGKIPLTTTPTTPTTAKCLLRSLWITVKLLPLTGVDVHV